MLSAKKPTAGVCWVSRREERFDADDVDSRHHVDGDRRSDDMQPRLRQRRSGRRRFGMPRSEHAPIAGAGNREVTSSAVGAEDVDWEPRIAIFGLRRH